MSMLLAFEPHSWYYGFAICYNSKQTGAISPPQFRWEASIDNGNNYTIDMEAANTLPELRKMIKQYHLRAKNGYGERIALKRLRELRESIENENISYGEIAELVSLAYYISDDDIQLLQWAKGKTS